MVKQEFLPDSNIDPHDQAKPSCQVGAEMADIELVVIRGLVIDDVDEDWYFLLP